MPEHVPAAEVHHISGGFLHREEVFIAPPQLVHDARTIYAGQVCVMKPYHPEQAVDCGRHPFAQIVRVMPAARNVLMHPVVHAAAVVQMAGAIPAQRLVPTALFCKI